MPASTFTSFKIQPRGGSPSLTTLRARGALHVASQSYIGIAAVSNGYTFDLGMLIAPCRLKVVALAVCTQSTMALNGTHYWGVSVINSAATILVAGGGMSNAAAAFTSLTPREVAGLTTVVEAGDLLMVRHVQVNSTPGAFSAATYSLLWQEV